MPDTNETKDTQQVNKPMPIPDQLADHASRLEALERQVFGSDFAIEREAMAKSQES